MLVGQGRVQRQLAGPGPGGGQPATLGHPHAQHRALALGDELAQPLVGAAERILRTVDQLVDE
ncbi:MAG: hypothetical protein MUC74_10895, partial [Ideonella sp.]|nr:hypothetical protein [Ideonella sp.]